MVELLTVSSYDAARADLALELRFPLTGATVTKAQVRTDHNQPQMGLDARTSVRGFANNKGADQHAHPGSLISAFVIRVLESTISKLATNEISFF